MGADLYYKGKYAYRDQYNIWTTLQPLGLSWWVDVVPMLNKDNKLPIEKAEELKEKVESGFEYLFQSRVRYNIYKKHYVDYINESVNDLLKLLKKSIKEKEPIKCSL
jgi:hypothetical protein